MDEARYGQMIRDGERNKDVVELIHNWCSHARVSNKGGVGLIAQQTGLPIGHFAMECDFAPASGFAGWYLELCALDFHDRNCAHCDKRQAVRMPNLSILVGQRDREAIRQQEEADRTAAELQAALEARKKQREALRVGQDAAVRALLDDLDTLDATHADDAKTRVIQTLRLAPEVLTPSLTEYFFELTASPDAGCQEVALQALKYANADPARLVDAALQCLAKGAAVQTAAYIVMETPELADERTVEAATPALIRLARAPRSEFGHGERVFHPDPLKAVFAVWPEAVCQAIQRLLDSRSSYAIRTGTAGLKVLSAQAPNLLDRFSRSLVTKLTRAHLLIDDSDADRERRAVCSDLQRAVAAALRHAPSETDKLIATYFEGATAEAEARLVRAYSEIFRTSRTEEEALDGKVAAIALMRFVAWSSNSKNLTVLTEITHALRPYGEEIAASVDGVLDIALGAAAVMDARREAFGAEQSLSKPESFLDVLDTQNFQSALYHSLEVFAAIAAAAASRSLAAAESYVDFLSRIDGSRHSLIAVLLEESSKLIVTPEGLRLVLPELYTAMVGTSTLVRASAAETLGRAGSRRSDDLPQLVLEAFILLLEDQYVIVHKAAAKALESISLTGALEQRAGRALLTLLSIYGNKGKVESFLLDWMQLYFRRYTADDESRANLARWCLQVLMGVSVHMHLRDLNSLSKYLKDQPTFVDLVVRALEDPEVGDHGQDDVIRLLYSIPDAEASKRSADLSKLSVRRSDRGWYVGAVVEVLTRVGAWDEAVEAIESSWEAIPDTVPMRRMKWSRRLHVVAVQFESAVAAGDLSRQQALKAEWEGLYQLLKEDQEEYAQRRNPFPGVFRPNSGS
jgi:hypothetical protein